jgi:hypothetical protein
LSSAAAVSGLRSEVKVIMGRAIFADEDGSLQL